MGGGGGGVLLALGILLAICVLTGCPTNADDTPSVEIGGDLTFPNPESFRDMPNIPNPFISWRASDNGGSGGSQNVTAANWDRRADEISKIVQHYYYGYMHPTNDVESEIDTVTGPDGKGAYTMNIKVTRGANSATFPVTVNLPAGVTPATMTAPIPGVVELAMVFGDSAFSVIDTDTITTAGYAKLVMGTSNVDNGDNETGVYVQNPNRGVISQLYNYTWPTGSRAGSGKDDAGRNLPPYVTSYSDEDAPGTLMGWAWGAARILDALEKENDKPADQRKIKIDHTKLAVTGMSRWGKGALVSGAFAQSKKGVKYAVVNPVSSGSGGVTMERFVSTSATEAQSKLAAGDYPVINKRLQYLKLGDTDAAGTQAARAVLASEALKDGGVDANLLDGGPYPGGTAPANYVGGFNPDGLKTAADGTNVKDGYAVLSYNMQSDGSNGGHQTLGDSRWAYGNWYNGRFRRFINLHADLNLEKRAERGEWGYLTTIPFDAHYVAAMVAPRPLLIHDGFRSGGTNAETHFITYLATREVYRLLNAEKNIGIAIYNIGHAQPQREVADLVKVMQATFAGTTMPAYLTPDSLETYPYPINDARSKYDYLKLNWAAPGHESIASQVKKLVP